MSLRTGRALNDDVLSVLSEFECNVRTASCCNIAESAESRPRPTRQLITFITYTAAEECSAALRVVWPLLYQHHFYIRP